jgi:hypothetical protein
VAGNSRRPSILPRRGHGPMICRHSKGYRAVETCSTMKVFRCLSWNNGKG